MKALAAIGKPHMQDIQASDQMIKSLPKAQEAFIPSPSHATQPHTLRLEDAQRKNIQGLQAHKEILPEMQASTPSLPSYAVQPHTLRLADARIKSLAPSAPVAPPQLSPTAIPQSAIETQLRATLEAEAKAIPRTPKPAEVKAATPALKLTENDIEHLRTYNLTAKDVLNGDPRAMKILESGRRDRHQIKYNNARSDAKYRRMSEDR